MKKALVISDQPLTVSTVRETLLQCEPSAMVDSASRLQDAMTMLSGEDGGIGFELVVLDIDMPDSRRVEGAELLHKLCPDIPLLVVSATEPDDDVIRAIDIGAMGYLLKTADADTQMDALRQVMSGDIYLPDVPPEHLTWF